jgi:hypothetical protein
MKILRENRTLTEDAEGAKDTLLYEIGNMSEWDKMNLWNQYCSDSGRIGDEIMSFDYDNADEIVMMFGGSTESLLRAMFYGDVRFSDNFCHGDGYGNMETFNNIDDFAYWDELVDYVVDNDSDLDEEWIREILDEQDEEEDEE